MVRLVCRQKGEDGSEARGILREVQECIHDISIPSLLPIPADAPCRAPVFLEGDHHPLCRIGLETCHIVIGGQV